MAEIHKIIPNLWFDTQAEEAANFYVSIFKNSAVNTVQHYSKEGFEIHGMPEGMVMTVAFQLDGQSFIALNGGPHFKFNEAISFVISCKNQAEVDYYWERLTEDGDENAQQCGWLKDRYGVSWQVVPAIFNDLVSGPDQELTDRVMHAMLQMKKIDIAKLLEAAFNSEE